MDRNTTEQYDRMNGSSSDTRRSRLPARAAALAAAPLRVWSWGILAVYVLLIAFGITTSSIGVEPLRDQIDEPPAGLIAGGPDGIRSDEFLRATPWNAGVIKSGDDDFATPFAYPEHVLVALAPGGPVTTVLFVETDAMVWLGSLAPAQVYAFVWWLPVMLALWCLPLWFRQLGVAPRIGIPLTLLVVLSPVAIWWSWSALSPVGRAAFAAVTAHAAVTLWQRGRRWTSALLTVVCGIAITRVALSYQPWAIPIALAIMLPTLAQLLAVRGRRISTLVLAGGATVLGGVLLLAFFREQGDALAVLSDTVYPGTRRSGGDLAGYALAFSAPHMWVLQKGPLLTGANFSEISTGYLVLGLVAVMLVPAIGWKQLREGRAALATMGAVFAVLACWCTIYMPTWTSSLFPMSLVAPARLIQVLGMVATLAFGLVLAAWSRSPSAGRFGPSLVAASAAFLVTGFAGSIYRYQYYLDMRSVPIIIASLLVGATVFVAVFFVRRWWALAPAVLCALPVVMFVNPVQIGFADTTNGKFAERIREIHDEFDGRWATDSIYLDAYLMANAIPALSGQQWVGPNENAWRIVDPQETYRPTWNRGASYITFGWDRAGLPRTFELPNLDTIRINTDPCSPALRRLDLRVIIASRELDNACLDELEQVTDATGDHWIYEVTRPDEDPAA